VGKAVACATSNDALGKIATNENRSALINTRAMVFISLPKSLCEFQQLALQLTRALLKRFEDPSVISPGRGVSRVTSLGDLKATSLTPGS
jgi:hypothetical protein